MLSVSTLTSSAHFFPRCTTIILSSLSASLQSLTMTNLGPLTTVFTPSGPDCTSSFIGLLTDNKWLQYGVGGAASSACLPSSFTPFESYYYSPGVCPSGYTSACQAQSLISGTNRRRWQHVVLGGCNWRPFRHSIVVINTMYGRYRSLTHIVKSIVLIRVAQTVVTILSRVGHVSTARKLSRSARITFISTRTMGKRRGSIRERPPRRGRVTASEATGRLCGWPMVTPSRPRPPQPRPAAVPRGLHGAILA